MRPNENTSKTFSAQKQEELNDQSWKELIQAIKPREVTVSVINGIVTLGGSVNCYARKLLAEQVVSNVTGVRSIVNTIEVKPTQAEKLPDNELTDRILDVFVQEFNTNDESFAMKIENDWLMIEGMAKNAQGQPIPVKGRLCKLEQTNERKKAEYHPAVVTNTELAYWEIFG